MGVFEAALAAPKIRLPLASLEIHVKHLTAAEHGDLWLGQLGIWSVHLGHGQSLQAWTRWWPKTSEKTC